jgi:2,3-bisphosphoglycerate-independent phosphoglycerate mutase
VNSARPRPRPVVLVVLDGLAPADGGGAAARLETSPVFSSLQRRRPSTVVESSGGTTSGKAERAQDAMLSISAGRAASTDLSRIDRAIQDGTLATNGAIGRIVGQAKDFGGRLHLIGLVSRACIHSSLDHLFALIDIAKKARVRVVVHAVLDGRDAPSGAATAYVDELERKLAGGTGRIGTVCGRSWGMARDNQWERVHRCYRAILAAEIYRADSARLGIEQSYEAGKTDDFVEPFVVFDYPGVSPVDVAIHFNLRPDGARNLTLALAGTSFGHFARKGDRPPFARYACLTTVDASLDLPTAFPGESRMNIFPELVARAGLTQFRCADAETFARVTRFFDGDRDEPLQGEDHEVIGSAEGPAVGDGRVDVASRIARKAEDAIRSGKHDFGLVHFSVPNLTEGAPISEPVIRAIDAGVDGVLEAVRAAGGAAIVVGGPGSSSGVPLHYIDDAEPAARLREGGRLCDVAPTLLELLQLPRPAEMAGRSLLDP